MATRYWVGGSGNWSDNTNHWSDSSGGSPGVSKPTSSDDVVFDSNSHTEGFTCTINEAAYCANFTVGNPASGVTTIAGSTYLYVYGNFSLAASSVFSKTSYIRFYATSGTKTITTNGVTIASRIEFGNDGGATFQLQDDLTISNSSLQVKTNDTFDANSNSVSVVTSSSAVYLIGNFTFYNFSLSTTVAVSIALSLYDNITVTNTFTISGYAANRRNIVLSNERGTAKTITAAALSISNTDFSDITAAGAASWDLSSATGGCADGGGNTGITFTTPVSRYWVATAGGNWQDTASWSNTDGGSSGYSVPLLHDTVYFTSNSITSSGKSIVLTGGFMPSLDFSNVTNSPTLSGVNTVFIFGSLNLTGIGSYTHNNNICMIGKGETTFNSNSLTLNTVNFTAEDITLLGDLVVNSDIYVSAGIVDLNDFDITCKRLGYSTIMSYAATTTYLKSGTITVGVGATEAVYCDFLNNVRGSTLYAGTSSIVIDNDTTNQVIFYSNNKTFNNFTISGTGEYFTVITGSNTFNVFSVTDEPKTIKFSGGTTNTFKEFNVSGSLDKLVTITSYTSSVNNLVCDGDYRIHSDYLHLTYSSVSPDNWWYAGTHSTDNGNNSQWYFTDAPALSESLNEDILFSLNEEKTKSIIREDNFQILDTLKSSSLLKNLLQSISLSENYRFSEELKKEDIINLIERCKKSISAVKIDSFSIISILDKVIAKTLLDSLTFSDEKHKLVYKNSQDVINTNDSILANVQFARSLLSNVTLQEEKELENQFYRTFSASLNFVESYDIAKVRYFALSAIMLLAESKYNNLNLRKNEFLSLLKELSFNSEYNKTYLDSLQLNENLNYEDIKSITSRINFYCTDYKQAQKIVNESFSFLDNTEKIKNISKMMSSFIMLDSTLQKYFNLSQEDSFSFLSSLSFTSLFSKKQSDSFSMSDNNVFDISKKVFAIENIIEKISKEFATNKNTLLNISENNKASFNLRKSSIFEIYANRISEKEKRVEEIFSLEDVLRKNLSLSKEDVINISDSLFLHYERPIIDSIDFAEISAKTEVLKLLSEVEFSDSLNFETVAIISDLLNIYESLKNEISIPIGSALVISEQISNHPTITMFDNFDIDDDSNKHKEINLSIEDLTHLDESLDRNIAFEYNITTPLTLTESHTYVKSEVYLRKIVLLTKSDKAMLLVRSD